MVWQAIVAAAEIKPLVFNSCPEIPLSGYEEAMSVAKVVVERIAVAELAVVVLETTASGVVQFVIKKIPVIFVRRRRRRLDLIRRGSGNDRSGGSEKQADKKQSYVFHMSRRANHRYIE